MARPEALDSPKPKHTRRQPSLRHGDLPFDPSVPVAATVIASFANVEISRILELARLGEVPRLDNGLYPLLEAVRAYCEWQRDQSRRSNKGALATKLQESRAKEIDLNVALKEGQLIDVQEAVDRFAFAFGGLRSAFSGLAARVSYDRNVRIKIEQEVNAIFDQAVQSFEQVEDAPSAGSEALPEEHS